MTKKIRIPIKDERLLHELSLGELEFFDMIAKKPEFDAFIRMINRLIDDEKNYIFGLDEVDERKLSTEKAFSRGKVASLTQLAYILKGAGVELDHRLEAKKD